MRLNRAETRGVEHKTSTIECTTSGHPPAIPLYRCNLLFGGEDMIRHGRCINDITNTILRSFRHFSFLPHDKARNILVISANDIGM